MLEIEGKYATAKVMCLTENDIEKYAYDQIKMICDNEVSKNSTIRVMPDVHPGKVGPIGLTMTINNDRILPALVGLDSGCGITCVNIGKIRKDFQQLDGFIKNNIPTGFKIRSTPLAATYNDGAANIIKALHCIDHIRLDNALCSLGTLGGGNHFIEMGIDDADNYYLTVHSGSRGLGREVYEYYMNEGSKRLKEKGLDVPYEMTYLTEELMSNYIDDMHVLSLYARRNRRYIITEILKKMKYKPIYIINSAHNVIDRYSDTFILRKGAASAVYNESVVIPINMKDGIILGKGRGNDNWNQSAPHGSGRVLSREAVKSSHTVSEFRKEMDGIYSSCINADTLDEAPFAYRRVDYIKEAIKGSVDIDKIIRPVYNFKGGSK